MSVRDDKRASIFGAKSKTLRMTFFGTEIELRQPSMKAVLEGQSDENRTRATAKMIVEYAYVPETGEKMFEYADIEAIMELPWSEDMMNINRAISELTGIRIEDAVKNSAKTQEG